MAMGDRIAILDHGENWFQIGNGPEKEKPKNFLTCLKK